jgi:hypothetical protein
MTKKSFVLRETKALKTADQIEAKKPTKETSGIHFPLITTRGSNMMTELFSSLEKNAETSKKRISPSVEIWKLRSEELNPYTQISLLDLGTEGTPSVGVLSRTKKPDTKTKQTVQIGIANTEKLSQRRSAYAKFFNVILGTARDYVTEDGKIEKGVIVPYDLFVEAGAYANRKNTRENFKKQYREVLQYVKIVATETKAGTINQEIEDEGWLFSWAKWRPSHVEITLNSELNYSALLKYYVKMPLECLRADRAFFLLHRIYSQARANTQEVRRTGGITISGKNLARALDLPPLEGNREPGKTFIAPLEKAIEEAETIAKEQADREGLELPKWQFEPSWNEETSAQEIYESGTLFVKLNGEELDSITKIADKQNQKIKKQIEKSEKLKAKQAEAKGKEEARLEAKEKAERGKNDREKTDR